MIALSTLAKAIQDGLNSNSKGINYVIHTDMGEFEKALKTRTEQKLFTNGIVEVVNSSIVPTQSITVATQSVLLTVVVQLPNPETDKEITEKHRSVLENYFAGVRVEPLVSEGVTYSVSSVGALANTGTVQVRPGVGTSISFTVKVQYSFIENGLNSSNCLFELDGMQIPYSMAQMTRSPVAESNPYSNTDGEAESVTTAERVGFDFQVPAQTTTNSFSSLLIQQILEGSHAEHTMKVTLGKETGTYTVIFGETMLAVEGVNNAGHKVSFVTSAPSVGE